jgi:hypothetical protein
MIATVDFATAQPAGAFVVKVKVTVPLATLGV